MGRGAAALGPDQELQNRKIPDQRSAAELHCQSLACSLQACISRNIFAHQRCRELKETYDMCITEFVITKL